MKTGQQTRAEIIDTQLAKAGWNVNDPAQVVYKNRKARFIQFIHHTLGIEILTLTKNLAA